MKNFRDAEEEDQAFFLMLEGNGDLKPRKRLGRPYKLDDLEPPRLKNEVEDINQIPITDQDDYSVGPRNLASPKVSSTKFRDAVEEDDPPTTLMMGGSSKSILFQIFDPAQPCTFQNYEQRAAPEQGLTSKTLPNMEAP